MTLDLLAATWWFPFGFGSVAFFLAWIAAYAAFLWWWHWAPVDDED